MFFTTKLNNCWWISVEMDQVPEGYSYRYWWTPFKISEEVCKEIEKIEADVEDYDHFLKCGYFLRG